MLNFIVYHTPIFYLIQSLWRDEAFSYFMAKPNILQVIINTAHDFNPPFYYLVLHFWIGIFGQSDETLRFLSFFAHLGTVLVAYIFAEKTMSKKFAWFVAVFTLFNPMLLYYGFEMRMYSFYALFTVTTLYFFYYKNWKWYTISAVLGLYTHSFFPLILVSFAIYLWMIKKLNKKTLFNVFKPFIYYLPWLPILFIQFINSNNSWLFPVNFNTITSVLGNLFTSFEGTPGNFWNYTKIISAFLLMFIFVGFKNRRKEAFLYSIPIFFPLIAILSYSVIRRPLFVNRYMIFVTVFEIIAVSFAIWSMKNKVLKTLSMFFWLGLIIAVNIFLPPYHKKTDFKSTFAEINKSAIATDYAYSQTPIGFLESAYYFKNKDKVFVYNPAGIAIPNYIGVNVVFSDISKSMLPSAPSRTYLIGDDANYDLIISR